MEVEVTHFVDAGERDAEGQYDYYYEDDTYTFHEDTASASSCAPAQTTRSPLSSSA